MLSTAKPELETNIKDILYDSLYSAYLTTYITSDITDQGIAASANKEIDDAAKKFARKAADTACGPLADAIYNFVLSIGIIAAPKGTLMSPGGLTPAPVTGVINMNDFIIK